MCKIKMGSTPYIIEARLWDYLKKFGSCLVPRRRNVLLVFDVFKTKEILPDLKPINGDKEPPTYFIVFAVRTILDYLYQPLGIVFHYDNSSFNKIAQCIKAYIIDLKYCDLNVIATVSTTHEKLIGVVEALLESNGSKDPNKSFLYTVGNVKNIAHIYDSSNLLKQTRDVFLSSIITYQYKGAEYLINCKDILTGTKNVAYKVLINIIETLDEDRNKLESALKLFNEAMYIEIKVRGTKQSQNCADFLLLIDQLYDTMNAYERTTPKFRHVIHKNSKHFKLWKEAIDAFENMQILQFASNNNINDVKTTVAANKKKTKTKYLNTLANQIVLETLMRNMNLCEKSELKKEAGVYSVKSVRNPLLNQWIMTLKGIQYVCDNLLKRYKDVETRHFNVDVMEDILLFFENGKVTKNIKNGKQNTLINKGYVYLSLDSCSCLTIH